MLHGVPASKIPGMLDAATVELRLTQYADRRVGKLSLGNKQRLGGPTVTISTSATSPARAPRVPVTLLFARCCQSPTVVRQSLAPTRGPLTVSSGVTCLRSATVLGPVRVAAGASLVAVSSTIVGTLSSEKPEAIWLSGGRLTGSITVTGASGTVRVDRFTVSGPLTVAGTSHGTTIDRVAVNGPVALTDNLGNVEIAGSAIRGPLTCTGNSAPHRDDQQPNTVTGPAVGQCKHL